MVLEKLKLVFCSHMLKLFNIYKSTVMSTCLISFLSTSIPELGSPGTANTFAPYQFFK